MTPPPRADHEQRPAARRSGRHAPSAFAPVRAAGRARIHDVARHNFNVYFLIPIMLIVVSAMVALVGGHAVADHASEPRRRDQGARTRQGEFHDAHRAVQATTKVFAVWDDAARRVGRHPRPGLGRHNIGAYVHRPERDRGDLRRRPRGTDAVRLCRWPARRATMPPWSLGSGYSAAIQRIMSAPRACRRADQRDHQRAARHRDLQHRPDQAARRSPCVSPRRSTATPSWPSSSIGACWAS